MGAEARAVVISSIYGYIMDGQVKNTHINGVARNHGNPCIIYVVLFFSNVVSSHKRRPDVIT